MIKSGSVGILKYFLKTVTVESMTLALSMRYGEEKIEAQSV